MKKKIIISIFGLALLGLVAFSTTRVYAGNQWGDHATIIGKLVERFGLNEEDVKAVFDETKEEHQAQMQSRLEERLNEAVTSGDITEQQKQLILAKHEELKAQKEADKESWQDMSKEEWKEAMIFHKEELKTWAEENNIDLKYFFGSSKFGKKHGFWKGL